MLPAAARRLGMPFRIAEPTAVPAPIVMLVFSRTLLIAPSAASPFILVAIRAAFFTAIGPALALALVPASAGGRRVTFRISEPSAVMAAARATSFILVIASLVIATAGIALASGFVVAHEPTLFVALRRTVPARGITLVFVRRAPLRRGLIASVAIAHESPIFIAFRRSGIAAFLSAAMAVILIASETTLLVTPAASLFFVTIARGAFVTIARGSAILVVSSALIRSHIVLLGEFCGACEGTKLWMKRPPGRVGRKFRLARDELFANGDQIGSCGLRLREDAVGRPLFLPNVLLDLFGEHLKLRVVERIFR